MMQDAFHKQQTQPSLTHGATLPVVPNFIGPYKVESLLKKGGMSWLYMGIHPESKKPLAIKTLPASHLKDKEATARFHKEAQMIALTSHPNIVKLYGEGSWEGGFYIAMEWIHGISLRQFLTEQSFSLKRSLEIILQVSYALKHLHSHGVIHRDLKPENILITEEGEIKVIDFGIAGLEKDSSLIKGAIGTPNYMSPEQKENPSKVSFASDIYSLGVIAYELILGKLSFGMIQPSLLPKHLGVIIQKALAISPSERYQTIDAFIDDISTYLRSDEMEKEKPKQDQVKELLEIFQKGSHSLSPSFSPPWACADIGIAKGKSISHFGLYYDLFKLPKDAFFLIIADPLHQTPEHLFASASFRGTLRSVFLQMQEQIPFSPLNFLSQLQKQIKNDPLLKGFAFSYLYLNPSTDQLNFFNSGLSQLIHIPEGGDPRVLRSINPLLEEDTLQEFSETIDNWNVGDTLLYHSLISEKTDPFEEQREKESYLLHRVQEEIFLSAQPQAESLLKHCITHPLFSSHRKTEVVLSIQRIV